MPPSTIKHFESMPLSTISKNNIDLNSDSYFISYFSALLLNKFCV